MTTLCFYQGLTTIGGTVVEICTQQARCLFDFGLVRNLQPDSRISARQNALVYDGLKTGALAAVEGIYDKSELRGFPLKAYGETRPLPFVLISHMHIDHMGALGLLADDVRVYMSRDSLRLYHGLTKIDEAQPRPHRRVYGVEPMRWRQMGDMQFRMIPVDHDVPGACGFEIETPDGRICYTGDLRLHGREGVNTIAFADMAKRAEVCITEGTTVSFIEDFDSVEATDHLDGIRTEEMLADEIAQAANANNGIVFLNLYRRNTARIHALIHTFAAAGRRFVLQYETAVVYKQFYPEETVDVYAPSCGMRVLETSRCVQREELQANPQTYALELPYEHLMETLDFEAGNSLYIHSDGMPLGAYDTGYQKLQEFLLSQGIQYQSIRCGGHAPPAHLKYLLQRIAPKTLVPLHSKTPEKLRIPGAEQLLPQAGKRYELRQGALIVAE